MKTTDKSTSDLSRQTASSSTRTILQTPCGPIEYTTFGEGPAVLAIHGAMGGYDQSEILARTIGPPNCRYLSVSRPGYLGTPLDSGKSSEQQADLYVQLLDALHLDRVAVFAVSGGGPSALHFALRHPSRCRGLVLASTPGDIMDTPIPLSFKVMTLLARWPFFVSMMRRKMEANFERTAQRSIRDPEIRQRVLADPQTGPLFKSLTLSLFDRMNERLAGTRNDILVTRHQSYPLEEVSVPTLIVHGTNDQVVPYARHAEALASRIPGAQLCRIEDGEHVSIFTHRDDVQARVKSFMEENVLK